MSNAPETIRFESLLRRPPKGTVLDLDGTAIHFTPDASGREFADVPAALAPILDGIPEGYVRVDASGAPAPAPAPSPAPGAPVADDDTQPDSDDADADPDADEPTVNDEPELGAMTEDQLRAIFEKEIGRPASPRAKPETLAAQIEQARAARGAD